MKKTTLLILSASLAFICLFGFACKSSPTIIQQAAPIEELIQTEIVNCTVMIIAGGGHGTGIVIKQDKKHAYILTANHVIRDAKMFWGRQFIGNSYEMEPLTLVMVDAAHDQALLESEPKWLGVAKIIKDDSEVKLFSKVFTCGHPTTESGPINNMFTEGRISALNDTAINPVGKTITSMPVFFGNSGGGLFIQKDNHFILAGVVQNVGYKVRNWTDIYICHISGASTPIQLLNFLEESHIFDSGK